MSVCVCVVKPILNLYIFPECVSVASATVGLFIRINFHTFIEQTIPSFLCYAYLFNYLLNAIELEIRFQAMVKR